MTRHTEVILEELKTLAQSVVPRNLAERRLAEGILILVSRVEQLERFAQQVIDSEQYYMDITSRRFSIKPLADLARAVLSVEDIG